MAALSDRSLTVGLASQYPARPTGPISPVT